MQGFLWVLPDMPQTGFERVWEQGAKQFIWQGPEWERVSPEHFRWHGFLWVLWDVEQTGVYVLGQGRKQ